MKSEYEKILQGLLIALLLGFCFWSGGNYQLARLYNKSVGAYDNILGPKND